jgi:hypothetical protein
MSRAYHKPAVRCHRCGEFGHYSDKCPLQRAVLAPYRENRDAVERLNQHNDVLREIVDKRAGVRCHKCHELGHYADKCPQGSPRQYSGYCVTEDAVFTVWSYYPPVTCPNDGSHEINTARTQAVYVQRPEVCYKCKAPGHRADQCPSAVKCHKCSGAGHYANACPAIKCHRCGEQGHYSDKCPKLVQPAAAPAAAPAVERPTCIVCLDRAAEWIALPCFHMKYCKECIDQIQSCAECRAPIQDRKKPYY